MRLMPFFLVPGLGSLHDLGAYLYSNPTSSMVLHSILDANKFLLDPEIILRSSEEEVWETALGELSVSSQ